jgi:hypothetical protein
MVETGVNSFTAPGELGPLYPFVGTEVALAIIGILLWIGWHVLHVRDEGKEYKEASKLYRQVGLERTMHHGGTGKIASEEEIRVARVYEALHTERQDNIPHDPHKEVQDEVARRSHGEKERN